jgi:hypothetical protein
LENQLVSTKSTRRVKKAILSATCQFLIKKALKTGKKGRKSKEMASPPCKNHKSTTSSAHSLGREHYSSTHSTG